MLFPPCLLLFDKSTHILEHFILHIIFKVYHKGGDSGFCLIGISGRKGGELGNSNRCNLGMTSANCKGASIACSVPTIEWNFCAYSPEFSNTGLISGAYMPDCCFCNFTLRADARPRIETAAALYQAGTPPSRFSFEVSSS